VRQRETGTTRRFRSERNEGHAIFTRRIGSPWRAEGYHWLMTIATTGSIFPKSIFPYLAFKELHRDPAQPEQA
jgi:hypothetical protein